jgi:2-methylaconitate cis-trans-isomerase PrpF
MMKPIHMGYPVQVTFLAPGGSMTGGLFPTGDAKTYLHIECPETESAPLRVRATLIDCANPFVFVDSRSMPAEYHVDGPSSKRALAVVEKIRRAAMVHLGLLQTLEGKAAHVRRGTPKIAVVAPPSFPRMTTAAGELAGLADVEVTSFSMGKPHPTLQLTGAICLGAALSIPGTVASELLLPVESNNSIPLYYESKCCHVPTSRGPKRWRIQHPTGYIDSEVTTGPDADGKISITSGSVFCTARKLFEGSVFY